jgi:hypothetical protein
LEALFWFYTVQTRTVLRTFVARID